MARALRVIVAAWERRDEEEGGCGGEGPQVLITRDILCVLCNTVAIGEEADIAADTASLFLSSLEMSHE